MRYKQQGRQEAAKVRQAAYDKLTTQEKFDRLPTTGATRQRRILAARLVQEGK